MFRECSEVLVLSDESVNLSVKDVYVCASFMV